MGLVFPEKYGGSEMSFLDLSVLLEEMGRACLPGPFFSTVVLGALPILGEGNEEQKQKYLPKIAKGEVILTLALTEPSAKYDAASIAVKAIRDKVEIQVRMSMIGLQNMRLHQFNNLNYMDDGGLIKVSWQ